MKTILEVSVDNAQKEYGVDGLTIAPPEYKESFDVLVVAPEPSKDATDPLAYTILHDFFEHQPGALEAAEGNTYLAELAASGAYYLLRVETKFAGKDWDLQVNSTASDALEAYHYLYDEIFTTPAPDITALPNYHPDEYQRLKDIFWIHCQPVVTTAVKGYEDNPEQFSCSMEDPKVLERMHSCTVDWVIWGYLHADHQLSQLGVTDYYVAVRTIVETLSSSLRVLKLELKEAFEYSYTFQDIQLQLQVNFPLGDAQLAWVNQEEWWAELRADDPEYDPDEEEEEEE